MERAHKVFMIAFALMVMNTMIIAEAGLSLGSTQVRRTAEVLDGNSARFKLLLFNAHDEQELYITTGYEVPEGWSVSIDPSAFALPYREIGDRIYEEGYEFLSTGLGDVKAKPVIIDVGVPPGETTGSYDVKITVNARRGSSGVAMTQSRSYGFIVDVLGVPLQEEPEEEEESEEKESEEPEERPSVTQPQPPMQLPQNNEPGIIDENTTQLREQTEQQIGNLTGMIISNPIIAPLALCIVLFAFLALRYFKRI